MTSAKIDFVCCGTDDMNILSPQKLEPPLLNVLKICTGVESTADWYCRSEWAAYVCTCA